MILLPNSSSKPLFSPIHFMMGKVDNLSLDHNHSQGEGIMKWMEHVLYSDQNS